MQEESDEEEISFSTAPVRGFPWWIVIIVAIIVVFIIAGFLIYNYTKQTAGERLLNTDGNIEKALIKNEEIAFITLRESFLLENLSRIALIFSNDTDNLRYNTDTKKNYEINASELGLTDFKEIEKVVVYKNVNQPILNNKPSDELDDNSTIHSI